LKWTRTRKDKKKTTLPYRKGLPREKGPLNVKKKRPLGCRRKATMKRLEWLRVGEFLASAEWWIRRWMGENYKRKRKRGSRERS